MTQRAKIRRGATPRHKRPAAAQRRPTIPPRVKASGVRALAALPVPVEKVRRWGWRAFWLLFAVAVFAGLSAMKLPQMVGTELGEMVGRMGLSVKRVEITGIDRMERLPVYAVALDQKSTAMPLVDLDLIRAKLLQYGWVADARVSRRLPDTLVVDIVERKPAAIWQHQGKLNLIDRDGVVLAPVDLAAMPDLPLVIGPEANAQANAFDALIATAPQLKPMVEAATWVGGRRWDIRFQSGETLALPQGEQEAKDALAKFARMDQAARLLGQGFVRFDMRVPGKFTVRVSREPGRQIGEGGPAAAVAQPKTQPAPAPGEKAT